MSLYETRNNIPRVFCCGRVTKASWGENFTCKHCGSTWFVDSLKVFGKKLQISNDDWKKYSPCRRRVK